MKRFLIRQQKLGPVKINGLPLGVLVTCCLALLLTGCTSVPEGTVEKEEIPSTPIVLPKPSATPTPSPSPIEMRKVAWAEAVKDSDSMTGAIASLYLAQHRHNDIDLKEVNQRVPNIKTDERVYLGYVINTIRLYYTFKDKPELLWPETKLALEQTTLRKALKYVTGKQSRGIISPDIPYLPNSVGTENHKLAEITAGILLTQIFAKETVNGYVVKASDPKEISWHRYWLEAYNDWLSGAADDRLGQGLDERDSPQYIANDFGYLLTLRDFAENETVRQLAEMYANVLLADYAEENLLGMYVGGNGREDRLTITDPLNGPLTVVSYLLFDNVPGGLSSVGDYLNQWGAVAYTAILTSDYEVPPIIRAIAADRLGKGSYEVKELRGIQEKYTYMTPYYGVGSWIGKTKPGSQSQSWGIYIASEESKSTIFTFPGAWSQFQPDDNRSYMINYKFKEDTQTHIFQERNVIFSQFDLKVAGEEFATRIYLPFSLDEVSEQNGWIFARETTVDGETVFVAIRPALGGYKLDTSPQPDFVYGRIFVCDVYNDVVVTEISDSTVHSSFAAFMKDVLDQPFKVTDSKVFYTTTDGREIEYKINDSHNTLINGQKFSLDDYELFNSPFTHSVQASRYYTFRKDNHNLVLDFRRFEHPIREEWTD
ncbi:MAG: hypothetical protein L6R45_29555 [Anaerolineae bacterium]|nr:hypothetical protein [Anaerolineae bacterium]